MATEDGTQVTCPPPDNSLFHSFPAMPLTLNANQSYIIGYKCNVDNSSLPSNDANGTLVESDKPIAVTSGSWLARNDQALSTWDMGWDQTVPESRLAAEYILMKGQGDDDYQETPVVVAIADGTGINTNGTPATCSNGQALPMDAGDYCFLDGQWGTNDNMYIAATRPVYVYQTTAGEAADNTMGMSFIPPVSDHN